jgi:hypothetical protein
MTSKMKRTSITPVDVNPPYPANALMVSPPDIYIMGGAFWPVRLHPLVFGIYDNSIYTQKIHKVIAQ